MFKCLPLFAFFFFVVVSQTFAQQPSSEQILLSPSMVVNESGHGDATLLVDEQTMSGDPLGGNSGSPNTYWFPGWQANLYPASAYIDLGQAYALSHIFLFDYTGNGNFTVEVGEPGNWAHLFTDGMSSYNTWEGHEVNVTTQYIRVTRMSAGGNMNEIVLYGSSANNAPTLDPIANQFVTEGGQLSIGLSASDSDGDPLAFSLDSGPGFIALTDSGNGTASLQVTPQVGDEGAYNIKVSVSDGNGGADSTAFVLTVAGAPTGEVAKISLSPSMVVNESGHGDATLLVDEQTMSGDPLGGNSGSPNTYWLPGWQANLYPASAYIDLGGEYALSHIFLFDYTGNGNFTVEVGSPGNWAHLFTDGMSSYNTWERHEVNVTTQYVRVTRMSAGGNMNEIMLYGSPVIDEGEVLDNIEYQALADLYNSTNGDGWTNKANWLQGSTGADFADWHGITIENGDVAAIDLSNNLLTGPIPNSIGRLSRLVDLDLSFNKINALPAGIGELKRLFSLNLYKNELIALPSEIGGLSNLFELNIGNNSLGSLPTGIGNLSNLLFLQLADNDLTVLPATIGNLSGLFDFSLWGNRLEHLPPEIGMLDNLESLYLDQNRLTALPSELGDLSKLKGLYAMDNLLTAIPSTFGSLSNLEYLFLDNNQLTSLPSSLGDLYSLRELGVGYNHIRDLPVSMVGLADNNLGQLYVHNNMLSFASIEAFFTGAITHPFNIFYFSDQSPPAPENISVSHSSGLTLDSEDHAPHNRYQWQREVNGTWADIGGATGASYTVQSVTEAGKYRCKVTNDWVTDMTLYSRTIHVEVEEQLMPTPPVDMVRNRPVDGG